MSCKASPLIAATLVLLSVTSCSGGGDDGDDVPDANLQLEICGPAAGTISSYPGMFSGNTVGAGNDLGVADAACTDQRGHFGSGGDDQVVNLVGLRPDVRYAITLATDNDLSFYVATACGPDGPTAGGECLLHVDSSFATERADFVAPAGGTVAVVVDAMANPLGTGAYTLTVREAECSESPDCTDPARPICDNYTCIECVRPFDCTSATTPVCDSTGTCVAGYAMCTGDDADEDNDGPAAATMIAAPTIVAPTVVTAGICNTPPGESDWYTLTMAADGGIRVRLAFDTANPENDIDAYLLDDTGGLLGAAELDNEFTAAAPAGQYYLVVLQNAPAATGAAVSYTVTLEAPECVDSFDCALATAPVCGEDFTCGPGPADCTGDDAADAPPGDDGPAAATLMAGTTQTFNRQLCGGGDNDWFGAVMTAGQGLTISASFANGEDFDVFAMDSEGTTIGLSYWLNPETVTLTYLPAGTVYVRLYRYTPSNFAASAYSVTLTKTATETCTTSADCAAEYETQVYRGQCTGGACVFIPPGARANDAPCDTGNDCMSGFCSYNLFEADAQDSVCTIACAQTADCAAVGTGLACTTGFQNNLCTPSCANDVECGTTHTSPAIDPGLPWNYGTCTVASGVCSP